MSKENKLEGRQDVDRKRGEQAGMPRSGPNNEPAQHGVVRDAQGQDQPADKSRAQQVSRKDRGDNPPGDSK